MLDSGKSLVLLADKFRNRGDHNTERILLKISENTDDSLISGVHHIALRLITMLESESN